jgi:hypothetical protein
VVLSVSFLHSSCCIAFMRSLVILAFKVKLKIRCLGLNGTPLLERCLLHITCSVHIPLLLGCGIYVQCDVPSIRVPLNSRRRIDFEAQRADVRFTLCSIIRFLMLQQQSALNEWHHVTSCRSSSESTQPTYGRVVFMASRRISRQNLRQHS